MRTKTIAIGRFHRSSLRPPDLATTARPLPPPFTDDDISNGNDSSADRMEFHSCTENGDNVSHASVISRDEDMDDFVENTCLECDKGEGLLICCGIDCPVALHEKCISGEPKYDEGKFYCPYCWYKLQKARTRELRKEATLARKDLDCFLNFNDEMACGDKEKQNNEREKGNDMMNVDGEVHSEARKVEEGHQHNSNEKLPCSDQSGEVDERLKIWGTHARDILADEEGMEQRKNDRLDGDDGKDEGANVDEECAGTLNVQCVAENTVFNDAFQGSPGAKSGTSNTSERCRVSIKKEEEIGNGPTANVSCTSVDGASLNGAEASGSETEDCGLRLRHVKRIRSQNTNSPNKSAFHSHTGSTKATGKPLEEVERVDTLNAQCVAEKAVLDGTSLQGSPGTKSETPSASERDRVSMEKEEQMNKGAPTANVPCTSVDGALNEPEVPDSETEKFVVQLRHVKQIKSVNTDSPESLEFHPHTVSAKATSKPIEEFAYSENPKKPEIPANKPVELPFAHEKRRRINWTPEEEEALREGVHKFSTNKNLNWRRILEFGRHIFDPSRNPTDLKDKWKNMAKKS